MNYIYGRRILTLGTYGSGALRLGVRTQLAHPVPLHLLVPGTLLRGGAESPAYRGDASRAGRAIVAAARASQ
eukprot:6538786-Pyramimonas_sp.AAC.1